MISFANKIELEFMAAAARVLADSIWIMLGIINDGKKTRKE